MTERFRIEGLTKTHGHRRVLRGIDLAVGGGEIVGLVGSNGAGKSTLVSIASGAARANGGTMLLSGRPYRPSSEREALGLGVSAVQQRFEAPEGMSVREFIGADRGPVEGSLLAHGLAVLEQTGIRLDLDMPLSGLMRAEQALADVLRVLSEDPELVLFDEVVATFNDQEIVAVHAILREMAHRGCGILYVSHRVDEVRSLVDRILVMRDGRIVREHSPREASTGDIVYSMFERRLSEPQRPGEAVDAEEALGVEGLSTASGVADVSFSLRRGEVLGLTGLRRAGIADLVSALVGVGPGTWSSLRVGGQEVQIDSAQKALSLGIGYLSDSDSEFDAVIEQSLARWLMKDSEEEVPSDFVGEVSALREVAAQIKTLHIRTHDLQTRIGNLSGGDQQKIALAKWMSTECDILILNHPTRGIDISSKGDIYEMLTALTGRGTAVLLVSSEMSELVQWCHRILVMRDGRLVSQQENSEATEDTLMSAAIGDSEPSGSGRRAATSA